MPISINHPIEVLTQARFGEIAFEVMQHAFAIHNQMGRFFDEEVYQNELLQRLGQRATKEVYIHATHQDFQKPYRLDLLVDRGAPFELKAVQQLHDQHRNQLIHYLMLLGLAHGKLINFRPNRVEHEFVNNTLSLADRQAFEVHVDRWKPNISGCQRFQEIMLELLRDWGTCLDLQLYEDAVTHFFGGEERVHRELDVISNGHRVGGQTFRLIDNATGFKITSLRHDLEGFESHVQRLLQHTQLERMLWVNVVLREVTFAVISR